MAARVVEEEEDVFGISVADPDIMKGTQFILVSAGITAFFLAVELVAVVERQGLHGLEATEVLWWIFDMIRMMSLCFAGYFGVKRSNRSLLLGFFLCALVSCIESICEAFYDIWTGDPAGLVTLSFCEAAFFIVAMYYAQFLWKTSEHRDLRAATPGDQSASTGYNLLGMRMLDIKVLKATQLLFTCLAIVASIFGSVVIRAADGALSREGWKLTWLIVFFTLLSLVLSGYFGVRRSNAGLLFGFAAISGTLFVVLGALSWLIALMCYGQGCWTLVSFGFGLTAVLGIATKNARFLAVKVQNGTVLTDPMTDQPVDVVEPTCFGDAEMADVESPIADDQEKPEQKLSARESAAAIDSEL